MKKGRRKPQVPLRRKAGIPLCRFPDQLLQLNLHLDVNLVRQGECGN
jgi:hypothetical protein